MARKISAKEKRFNASREQKKRRAARNKARRKAIRDGRVKKGDGREVHHPDAPRKGTNLGRRTRVLSKKANRKIQPKRGGSRRKK